MNRILPCFFLAAFILSAVSPMANAAVDGWTNSICLDDETLYLWEDIPTSTGYYTANTTKQCPYGCDNRTRDCKEPYRMTATQSNMGIGLYIIISLLAIGSLIVGMKGQKWLLCLFSTIMFPILALQSVALDSILAYTFFSGLTTVFIGIFWLLTVVSFVFTLIGAIATVKNKNKEADIDA